MNNLRLGMCCLLLILISCSTDPEVISIQEENQNTKVFFRTASNGDDPSVFLRDN